jgi:hypothetical protein
MIESLIPYIISDKRIYVCSTSNNEIDEDYCGKQIYPCSTINIGYRKLNYEDIYEIIILNKSEINDYLNLSERNILKGDEKSTTGYSIIDVKVDGYIEFDSSEKDTMEIIYLKLTFEESYEKIFILCINGEIIIKKCIFGSDDSSNYISLSSSSLFKIEKDSIIIIDGCNFTNIILKIYHHQ